MRRGCTQEKTTRTRISTYSTPARKLMARMIVYTNPCTAPSLQSATQLARPLRRRHHSLDYPGAERPGLERGHARDGGAAR